MPNLYTGELILDGFKTITELTGITLTEGKDYTIELKGDCVFREGTEGKGFLIEGKERLQFTQGDADLYIGQNGKNHTVRINISD